LQFYCTAGGTLAERIHGEGRPELSVLEVLELARSIATGLSVMHPAYVHRDLKPANILLDAYGTAKIAGKLRPGIH
jgi:serine/threonine protein kinase